MKLHGETFPDPKFEVPSEIGSAMNEARYMAAHPYGDEGGGYEDDLIPSYFLEQPGVIEWLRTVI